MNNEKVYKMNEPMIMSFIGKTVRLSSASSNGCFWYHQIIFAMKNSHDAVEFKLTDGRLYSGRKLVLTEYCEYWDGSKWIQFSEKDFL